MEWRSKRVNRKTKSPNTPSGMANIGNLTLEFFIADNTPADQNGEVIVGDTWSKPHGEGKTYIGFCTTDVNGIFGNTTNPCVFSNVGVLGLTNANNITATATDGNGNTSEFSANPSSKANLVLVKRITAITSAATGLTTNYGGFIDDAGQLTMWQEQLIRGKYVPVMKSSTPSIT
jgi:hypothetical protein